MLTWFTGETNDKEFDEYVDAELKQLKQQKLEQKNQLKKTITDILMQKHYRSIWPHHDEEYVDYYEIYKEEDFIFSPSNVRHTKGELIKHMKDMTEVKVRFDGSFGRIKRLVEMLPIEWFMKQNRVVINICFDDKPRPWERNYKQNKKNSVKNAKKHNFMFGEYTGVLSTLTEGMEAVNFCCAKDRKDFITTIFKICDAFLQEYKDEKSPFPGTSGALTVQEIKKIFYVSMNTDEDRCFELRKFFDGICWRKFVVTCPFLKITWDDLLKHILFSGHDTCMSSSTLRVAMKIIPAAADSYEEKDGVVEYVQRGRTNKAHFVENKNSYLFVYI